MVKKERIDITPGTLIMEVVPYKQKSPQQIRNNNGNNKDCLDRLSGKIKYEEELIIPATYTKDKKEVGYKLKGIICNQGQTEWSGHIYTYIKTYNRMNKAVNNQPIEIKNLDTKIRNDMGLEKSQMGDTMEVMSRILDIIKEKAKKMERDGNNGKLLDIMEEELNGTIVLEYTCVDCETKKSIIENPGIL